MKKREVFYLLVIMALLLWLNQSVCNKKPDVPGKPEIKTTHTTVPRAVYDSLLHVMEIKDPVPDTIIRPIPYPVKVPCNDSLGYPQWYVDSLFSLLAQREYDIPAGDTAVDINTNIKSTGVVTYAKTTWKLTLPTCIDTYDSVTITYPPIKEPGRALYALALPGTNQTFIGGLAYCDKKQRMWIIGYDMLSDKKNIQAGILFPLIYK